MGHAGKGRGGIEVEGLVRQFKNVRAVDGIDLSIQPGEIYGFLGPNGAGKSTTVHVLTTLLPPTAGRATVAGFDVAREGSKVRASIGAALQEAALDPFLTGREHLRLQASLHGIRARAEELLQALLDARRALQRRRPQDPHLFGRHEAPPRPRARARSTIRRSSSSTSRPPGSTRRAVRRSGRRSPPRARGRRDGLPDDAVPRGGRRARRPGRDHRSRPDRRGRDTGRS